MTKSIPLTQGKFALVDDEDFEELNKYKWFYNGYYAAKNSKTFLGRKTVFMHRLIAKTPEGLETDHVNGNKLDNQRANLRICTQSQNRRNTNPSIRNTSGFKGVNWHKMHRKWNARITVNGKRVHIGLYKDVIEAARAYDDAAKQHYGEFARLNFPDV